MLHLPPSVHLPPVFPGFRYGNQYYAIAQEIRNFTIVQEDADARCQLLSKSAVSSVEPVAFSLIDSSPCNGYSMASVVSCTFTSTKDTVDQFAVWVQSFPLPDVSGTCVPMQLAVHARTVQNMNPSPPIPPQRPSPPGPPPRPFPSPPPPPPSCPPTPPMLPSPPSRPPSAPPSPPSPPEEPPLPPSPPSTVQIASQNLCHSTCVSIKRSNQCFPKYLHYLFGLLSCDPFCFPCCTDFVGVE